MNATNFAKFLPHEWLCGAFLVSLWVRLVMTHGFLERDALLVLFVVVANGIVLTICGYRASEFKWRIRLCFYVLAMNLVYFILGTAVPSMGVPLRDEALRAADLWLIGIDLSLYLERWTFPLMTEILSFCYLWYLFYLFSSQIEYLCGDLNVAKRYYAGLFSIYAIGYLGYSIFPALGPYLATADHFQVPLDGWWITRVTTEIVLSASNRVDVFPSLHVANSIYTLLFDWMNRRWRFRLYIVPCVGLVVATLYLRYHYLIDVICGLGVSFLALWLAGQFKLIRNYFTMEKRRDGIPV